MAGQELATANNVPAVAEDNTAPQNQFQLFPFLKSMAIRMLMFYAVSSLIRNFFGGGNKGGAQSNSNSPLSNGKTYSPSLNMFYPGEMFDFQMYLSESAEKFRNFDNKEALIWTENNLIYGDWTSGEAGDGSRFNSLTFPTPAALQNNGSLYLHVFVYKTGKSSNSRDHNYGGQEVVHGSFQLNKYKKKYYKKTTNLLTGKTEQSELDQLKADQIKYEVLNFWHPNITVNLITDYTAWTQGQLPSPLDEAVKFDPVTNTYYPIIFFNNYWNLGTDYQPVNNTVPSVNMTITYAPLSLFKWQLYASQQMQGKWSQMLGSEMFEDKDNDQDAIKQALLETNPYLLGITVVVSLLHTVLEFLAFKNDIQFWRTRKSLEGLSIRTVLFNVFQSVIVFLYICDNDSSWVIKLSIGFGLLIEIWKIPKCLNVNVNYENKILGVIPRVTFSDKGTYVESDTKVYDQLAFKYLSWALFPLLGCYSIYSLIYEEQHGWYSWILSMLYGFLLMFGFIMMTPQLFINYKLKSVAHLPWRMLTYKFINTFIDDLFAFVIRMPTMYRLGCFRDDIIFLIYIYQRWIYRVDPKRVNEYGTSSEEKEAALAEDEQATIKEAEATASGNAEPSAVKEDESLESKKDK